MRRRREGGAWVAMRGSVRNSEAQARGWRLRSDARIGEAQAREGNGEHAGLKQRPKRTKKGFFEDGRRKVF